MADTMLTVFQAQSKLVFRGRLGLPCQQNKIICDACLWKQDHHHDCGGGLKCFHGNIYTIKQLTQGKGNKKNTATKACKARDPTKRNQS